MEVVAEVAAVVEEKHEAGRGNVERGKEDVEQGNDEEEEEEEETHMGGIVVVEAPVLRVVNEGKHDVRGDAGKHEGTESDEEREGREWVVEKNEEMGHEREGRSRVNVEGGGARVWEEGDEVWERAARLLPSRLRALSASIVKNATRSICMGEAEEGEMRREKRRDQVSE